MDNKKISIPFFIIGVLVIGILAYFAPAKKEVVVPLSDLLAKNLTELRLKNKVTQSFVAKRLNTSQSAYSHYENALNYVSCFKELFNLHLTLCISIFL